MNDIQDVFKAYDIRGKAPGQLSPGFAYALGRACCDVFKPGKVVYGHDARLSSPTLARFLGRGMADAGCDCEFIGLCGTEEIYHACVRHPFDLGIMITASHNPPDDNGFKFVLAGARPISAENGLEELAKRMRHAWPQKPANPEIQEARNSYRSDYIDWLLSYSHFDKSGQPSERLRVLIDCGNGAAGPLINELVSWIPFEFIILNGNPDGNFPLGAPNPLLAKKRIATQTAVLEYGADLAFAFDGDFDRCFLFDSKGDFIDGYYMSGLLASELLKTRPGEKIIHDTRLYWNTRELVSNVGGIPLASKAGHTFMKETMRRENAIYGGEMSGHHYFRDFAYCDSGMLAMLLALKTLSQSGKSMAALVQDMRAKYPISGELNFEVEATESIMRRVWDKYLPEAVYYDRLDGLNMEFNDWRFSLRKSNTENLLRLNVESRANVWLLRKKIAELSAFCQK